MKACTRCGCALKECECSLVGDGAKERAQDLLTEACEQLERWTGSYQKRVNVPVELLQDVTLRVQRARMALRAMGPSR